MKQKKELIMSTNEWQNYIEDEDTFNEIKEKLTKRICDAITNIRYMSTVDYYDPMDSRGHGEYDSYIKHVSDLKEIMGEIVYEEINKFVR